MSEHWCPIEKRECGHCNTQPCDIEPCSCGIGCTFLFYFSHAKEFERCPYPTRIKPVAPDPGEGWELVPYGRYTTVQRDWTCKQTNRPENPWMSSCRVGSGMASFCTYRRPIAQICPVEGVRCKQAHDHGYGNASCFAGPTMMAGPNCWQTFEACPWPSKRGT